METTCDKMEKELKNNRLKYSTTELQLMEAIVELKKKVDKLDKRRYSSPVGPVRPLGE